MLKPRGNEHFVWSSSKGPLTNLDQLYTLKLLLSSKNISMLFELFKILKHFDKKSFAISCSEDSYALILERLLARCAYFVHFCKHIAINSSMHWTEPICERKSYCLGCPVLLENGWVCQIYIVSHLITLSQIKIHLIPSIEMRCIFIWESVCGRFQ